MLHAACDDVDQFVGMLGSVYGGEIVVGDIGPVVAAHTGKGTIGVVVQRVIAVSRKALTVSDATHK